MTEVLEVISLDSTQDDNEILNYDFDDDSSEDEQPEEEPRFLTASLLMRLVYI
jgi:hypothetical protein